MRQPVYGIRVRIDKYACRLRSISRAMQNRENRYFPDCGIDGVDDDIRRLHKLAGTRDRPWSADMRKPWLA